VNATTPLREEAPVRLEPLAAVIAKDLQLPTGAGGGLEAELQRMSPAERVRALLRRQGEEE
jgi:hypothetical protein